VSNSSDLKTIADRPNPANYSGCKQKLEDTIEKAHTIVDAITGVDHCSYSRKEDVET